MINKFKLEITPEIHQAWIDAERQMVIIDGKKHAAVISHDFIGTAIYGINLSDVKFHIGFNSKRRTLVDHLKSLEIL